MNRRWLMALLLASWTLNVMLGVAYYLKSHYPVGGYWMSESLRPHEAAPHDTQFERAREEFRERIEPTIDQRRHLLRQMVHVFMADKIDSVELNHLSDSLDIIKSKFQRMQLLHLREMHGRIPPEKRHRMARRLMKHFDRPHDLQEPLHLRKRFRGKRR